MVNASEPGQRTVHDAVLHAADSQFFTRGFDGVSIDEIRDAAGVNLKALYREFPSKAAIVDAYLARRDPLWRELLEDYVTSRSNDPREQLLLTFDGLDAYLRSGPDVPHCAFQHAYSQLAGGRPDAVEVIRVHKAAVQANLTRRAREAGLQGADTLGGQLMLLLEGALVVGAVQQDRSVGQTARAAAAALIAAAERPGNGTSIA